MKFLEYFDIRNPKHIEAYRTALMTRLWPEDWLKMIEEGQIVFDEYWEARLKNRMAVAWMETVRGVKLEEELKE